MTALLIIIQKSFYKKDALSKVKQTKANTKAGLEKNK
jgi:hypothetical protein